MKEDVVLRKYCTQSTWETPFLKLSLSLTDSVALGGIYVHLCDS